MLEISFNLSLHNFALFQAMGNSPPSSAPSIVPIVSMGPSRAPTSVLQPILRPPVVFPPLETTAPSKGIPSPSLFEAPIFITASPTDETPPPILVDTPTNPPTTFPSTLMDTSAPTSRPSVRPTVTPPSSSKYPTSEPTIPQTTSTSLPTVDLVQPTSGPTISSFVPSELPTVAPFETSSYAPTYAPFDIPSETPTVAPSWVPSFLPTYVPTFPITDYPSYAPNVISKDPTFAPTSGPIYLPTPGPSASINTFVPSSLPTTVSNNNASTDSLSSSAGLSTPERTAVIVLSVLIGPMILACLIFAFVHYYGSYQHKKRLSKNGRQQEEEVIIVDHVGQNSSSGAGGTGENEESAVDCEQGMQRSLPHRVTSLTSSGSSFSSFMRGLRPDSLNTTGSTSSCQSSVIAPDENSASSSSSSSTLFGAEEMKQNNMEEGIASVPQRKASGSSMISAAAASALARSFWGKSSHRVTDQQTVPTNQPQSLANSSSTHSHNTVDSPMIPVDLRSQSGHLGEEDYDGDHTQNFSSVYIGSRSDDYGTTGVASHISSSESGDGHHAQRRPVIQRLLIEVDDVGQPLGQLDENGEYDTVA